MYVRLNFSGSIRVPSVSGNCILISETGRCADQVKSGCITSSTLSQTFNVTEIDFIFGFRLWYEFLVENNINTKNELFSKSARNFSYIFFNQVTHLSVYWTLKLADDEKHCSFFFIFLLIDFSFISFAFSSPFPVVYSSFCLFYSIEFYEYIEIACHDFNEVEL